MLLEVSLTKFDPTSTWNEDTAASTVFYGQHFGDGSEVHACCPNQIKVYVLS